jgi:hypothetical protein
MMTIYLSRSFRRSNSNSRVFVRVWILLVLFYLFLFGPATTTVLISGAKPPPKPPLANDPAASVDYTVYAVGSVASAEESAA